jgi:acyl-CoA thioester hydrolase
MAERPQPSRRSAYKAFRALTTRWMDNDVYGHVNNVVHYSLFDTAVNGWLIDQRVLDFRAGKQVGLVVETGCRYFSELAFPDGVTAGLRVARLGTSSVRYEIGLFRNDDDAAAAEGFLVHVYVDRLTRRPMPLADTLRAALQRLAAM